LTSIPRIDVKIIAIKGFNITSWLIVTRATQGIFTAAARTAILITGEIWLSAAIAERSCPIFGKVIADCYFAGTIFPIILLTALRTTVLVTFVIQGAAANVLSSEFRSRRRVGWLDMKRVTSRSWLGCSLKDISLAIVARIHLIKAPIVSVTEGTPFIETVACGLFTIVVESDKLLGIRALGGRTSSCFRTTITFDASTGADIFSASVYSLDRSPFILPVCVVDTFGVVMHTAEDVVITFEVYQGRLLGKHWLTEDCADADAIEKRTRTFETVNFMLKRFVESSN
jgi:hypothetical protein